MDDSSTDPTMTISRLKKIHDFRNLPWKTKLKYINWTDSVFEETFEVKVEVRPYLPSADGFVLKAPFKTSTVALGLATFHLQKWPFGVVGDDISPGIITGNHDYNNHTATLSHPVGGQQQFTRCPPRSYHRVHQGSRAVGPTSRLSAPFRSVSWSSEFFRGEKSDTETLPGGFLVVFWRFSKLPEIRNEWKLII